MFFAKRWFESGTTIKESFLNVEEVSNIDSLQSPT
jgi:hypothetical protein